MYDRIVSFFAKPEIQNQLLAFRPRSDGIYMRRPQPLVAYQSLYVEHGRRLDYKPVCVTAYEREQRYHVRRAVRQSEHSSPRVRAPCRINKHHVKTHVRPVSQPFGRISADARHIIQTQRRGIVADRVGNIMIYVNGYDRRCPAGNMKRIDAQTARHVKDRCPRLDHVGMNPGNLVGRALLGTQRGRKPEIRTKQCRRELT